MKCKKCKATLSSKNYRIELCNKCQKQIEKTYKMGGLIFWIVGIAFLVISLITSLFIKDAFNLCLIIGGIVFAIFVRLGLCVLEMLDEILEN